MHLASHVRLHGERRRAFTGDDGCPCIARAHTEPAMARERCRIEFMLQAAWGPGMLGLGRHDDARDQGSKKHVVTVKSPDVISQFHGLKIGAFAASRPQVLPFQKNMMLRVLHGDNNDRCFAQLRKQKSSRGVYLPAQHDGHSNSIICSCQMDRLRCSHAVCRWCRNHTFTRPSLRQPLQSMDRPLKARRDKSWRQTPG